MANKKSDWVFSPEAAFERMETGAANNYDPEKVPGWIEKNTFLGGKPFSFVDHEYQLRILQSKKRTQYTKKCSQLGISELKLRRALALCDMIPHFSLILTLPTSSFASIFCKTRIDTVISESPRLKDSLNSNNDNTELKQLGTSLLYIRGTFAQNSAISVPADALYHDEVDFSDQEVLGSYQSRLTHSRWKFRMETSTPTVSGFGIDLRFASSNRSYNLCKCNHCNHDFIPNYLEHVEVPGFDGDILTLDKARLHKTRWREAKLRCPRCKKVPDLSPAHRRWVVENPDEHHEADGTQLSPFDAPAFITVQDLMISRTNYKRPVDFINFALGQCAEDSLSGIQNEDLELMERVYVPGLVGRVVGVDMGTTCHVVVAGIDAGDALMVQELHEVDYRQLDEFLLALKKRVRPIAWVMDTQPYTETVYRLQRKIKNLYGSLYVNSASMRPYRLLDEEQDKSEALLDERQINTNRNVALDFLMEDIRAGYVGADSSLEHWEAMKKHLRDMRRVRAEAKKNSPDTERFIWQKSADGVDHFHHALLYAWLAAKLRLAARPTIVLPPAAILRSFKLKAPV